MKKLLVTLLLAAGLVTVASALEPLDCTNNTTNKCCVDEDYVRNKLDNSKGAGVPISGGYTLFFIDYVLTNDGSNGVCLSPIQAKDPDGSFVIGNAKWSPNNWNGSAVVSSYVEKQMRLINDTDRYISVECFPSTKVCNSMSFNGTCTCNGGDNYLYFGPVGLPKTGWLPIAYTAKFVNGKVTGWHDLGSGNAWRIDSDELPGFSYQDSYAYGDPQDTADVEFSSDK